MTKQYKSHVKKINIDTSIYKRTNNKLKTSEKNMVPPSNFLIFNLEYI